MKLSEYPTTPVRMHLGSNVDPLVERAHLIPAPVAAAADKYIAAMEAYLAALPDCDTEIYHEYELARQAYKEAVDA